MSTDNDLTFYRIIRDQLQTGDLLLWQSKSVLGWLIRKFSKSDVNHAGLVIRFEAYDEDRVYTLEALEHGIVLMPLSRRLKDHKGHVWWHALKPQFDNQRTMMGSVALRKVGTAYDYGSLFANALGHVSVEASRFFCSGVCDYVWVASGVPLVSNTAPRPGDLKDYTIILRGVMIL